MSEPVASSQIKITLKSKILHQTKFDELGQQFAQEEHKKNIANNFKRKIPQTSTPSKRISLERNESSINLGASIELDSINLSQSSSGYFSQ
jgi:hypothetical protein